MSVTFDASEVMALAGKFSNVRGVLNREMQIASAQALAEGVGLMQGFAPVSPGGGALRGSIDISEGPTPKGGAFGTGIIYARIQDQGGTIFGNPWLVFQVKGRWVKVKSVKIPGSKYKKKTIAALKPRVQRYYSDAMKRVIASFGGGS